MRFSIKLIVLFFIAIWFFGRAGDILGFLSNPVLAEQIRLTNGDTTALSREGLTVISITDLVIASGFAGIMGLLIGLLISLRISRRNKWHWLHPVIALVFIHLATWLPNEYFIFFERVLNRPGQDFSGVWYYLVNGFVSILLGLLVFSFIYRIKGPAAEKQQDCETPKA